MRDIYVASFKKVRHSIISFNLEEGWDVEDVDDEAELKEMSRFSSSSAKKRIRYAEILPGLRFTKDHPVRQKMEFAVKPG